jgi:hypothetical protein
MSSFDFDAAVSAPFKMQPGLRPLRPGALHLTPAGAGSRHQREKLAVLHCWPQQALLSVAGFHADPALTALASQAALEHPAHFEWRAGTARSLGVSVDAASGTCRRESSGAFGNGDEIANGLASLPPAWRLAGLLCLAFEEDFAIVDAATAAIPWLAVCLPSMWAPEEKVGLPFAAVHAPVAESARITGAARELSALVTREPRLERFVWSITSHPRLHGHPARVDPQRWPAEAIGNPGIAAACAWWRTERQTFIPLPGQAQAVFTIRVACEPLTAAIAPGEPARRLHAALGSMSPAVLEYRALTPVRDSLLAWLAARSTPTA